MSSLKENTTLQGGKYKIISMLGRGGFGITYLAEQTMLDRKVAVKEFFMKEFCERNKDTSRVTLGTESSRETVTRFREKFLKEARNIAKLDHPNIVRILDIFEENGTAYYVMEYIEGESLSEMVKRCGAIAESTATRYILKAAEALEYIHKQNMNHLDIKPANIMINGKDESVLIDFGLSKQYDAGGQQTSTMLLDISEGYAPMEQYKTGGVGEFSPQTDIYALGATFFKLLTGKTPPSASDVYEDGLPPKPANVSVKVWAAIELAMQPIKKNRPQNVSEFIASIKTDSTPKPKPTLKQEVDEVTIVNIENKRPIAKKDKTFTVRGVTFKMIYVEGGTFTMGATPEQGEDAYGDEKPAHEVTLSDYYIGETVVTQALWKAVMGNNPSRFKGENLPVEWISWHDCKEFISKLNALTGKNFRMPTEAEWEYAARGGSKSRGYKYSGSNRLGDVAWYEDNSGGKTHEVGYKRPNELGLYDMSGNVWEWCSDWYGAYSSASQTNPKGPDSGTYRVFRGGCRFNFARYCRCSDRNYNDPDERGNGDGLRLCLFDNEESEPSSDIPIVKTYSANGVSFDMIKVEGGTFTMGATPEQGVDAWSDEKPAHKVTLSDYYIGKTEVTQALWETVMGNNPSRFKGENLPVEKISWNDCKEFISKLNALTGKTFRMPTEAEWEYAARGGSKSRGYTYSGSNRLDDVAWYMDNSGGKTHEVGYKRPNELGLYDMSGNVWEWCSDWFGDYSSSAQNNPKGPDSGTGRVRRGGSWGSVAWSCHCSSREIRGPGNRNCLLGLRLCLSE